MDGKRTFEELRLRTVTIQASMPCDLIQYLDNAFPALTLNAGLFYRWPVGIRFDLGDATAPDPIAEAYRRATVLFEAIFGPDDSCMVVAQDRPSNSSSADGLTHVTPLFDFVLAHPADLSSPDGQLEVRDARSRK